MQYINFVLNPKNDFLGQTVEYLRICGVSIVLAIIIGVLLGAAVSRNAFLAFLAINLSGLMRAIPIIAILIVFVPFLGLGFEPTVIALIVLGIPPILLNTYTGIRGIEVAMIDAAKGMGMTTWQIATRIPAPLVTPLAAFIGAGGYGDYIVHGLTVSNYTELIVGSVSVAILAIFVEVFMSWLQRTLTPEGLRVQERVATTKA